MPVELSDLLIDECWIAVEMEGGTFNIAYRPGMTSLYDIARVQKQIRLSQTQGDIDEEEQAEQMGEVFCEMVCDWDLTHQGQPLSITPEFVTRRLPAQFFNAIMTAISADRTAREEEKKVLSVTSDATLPPMGKLATVRNGTSSSEPRSTWASPRGR